MTTGSLAPGQIGGHKPATLSGPHREWLVARCKGADFTLRGLVAEPAAERGIKVDYVSVWRFVHAEGLTHKKRRRSPARLVFLDETWTKTNMAPLRGWSPIGEPLPARAPYGHWNTMTFLAALRHDRIDAPLLLDGPIDRESFLTYVREVLAPTLSAGDIVVADSLACHKHPEVRRILRAVGARLFLLPKYSPDP